MQAAAMLAQLQPSLPQGAAGPLTQLRFTCILLGGRGISSVFHSSVPAHLSSVPAHSSPVPPHLSSVPPYLALRGCGMPLLVRTDAFMVGC